MDMNKTVTIGCAAGFWGDSQFSTQQLVNSQRLDYLVADYLAETTLAIMAGARLRSPEMGYATDFVDVIKPLLHDIKAQKIKVITNAGGLNPQQCHDVLSRMIKEAGVDLKIGVVAGDNLLTSSTLGTLKANNSS